MDTDRKKVVLVWGGWSCTAGYTRWAYVAEYVDNLDVNTEFPGSESIGKKLFEAPNREEISDPKNCKFSKTPERFPIPMCRKWIAEQEYELVTEVKMRTD